MSSEMAKIADDLDNFVHDLREDGNDASALWLEQRASALRTLASQEKQEPVAWGRVIDGKAITISRERTPANDTPLYTAPQPGWDRGELLECAQWLEHGASLAVSAASKEQGKLAARALREFADINASATCGQSGERRNTMGEKLERYSIEFDDFVGTVIGSYTTLEGKEGVVMQQDGTRVVHVYGRKHLKPAQPFAAKDAERASAEARLKEDNGHLWIRKFSLTCCSNCGIVRRADNKNNPCKGAVKVELRSPDPHASDCEKQERELTKQEQDCIDAALFASGTVVDDTTKSEGGVEGHARSTKADSARGEAGSAPSQDGSLAQLAAGIESGPSDRTADVTVDELAAMIVLEGAQVIGAQDAKQIAAEILDTFTVGRR